MTASNKPMELSRGTQQHVSHHSASLTGINENEACCRVEIGTVIDNSDCTATYQKLFSTRVEAKTMLEKLVARARKVESEPCIINSQLKEVDEGIELIADFTFCCQIESINFQLALR